VFPALAIADEVKDLQPDARQVFVGTKGKIEERVVPQRGYPLHTVWISGVRRAISPGNLLVPLKVLVSLMQSFFLIRRVRPDVVVGTGGYVCGPVLYAASLLRIPVVLHESNSYPGVTTRLLAHRATRVLVGFEATKRWLKRSDNVQFVGTPTRASLTDTSSEEGRAVFGLDAGKKTILVFGGSLGASTLNNAVLRMLEDIRANNVQLIWQTGKTDHERVRTHLKGKNPGWVGEFIENMGAAYAAADLVVCRAGALTIAELAAVGKPAVLVPYPHAAGDHQTLNAHSVVESGAATMLTDSDLNARLKDIVLGLLQDEARLQTMAAASKRLGNPGAARLIAEIVLRLAKHDR
jgi:UDP-N-acetylglucosamine--N-acetylmuramyl-(pentapeptide) pyrophosphoryl-undecaprenol N-acetylglucosamine transferase